METMKDLKKIQKIQNLPTNKSDNYYRCKRINEFFKPIRKNFKVLDIGSGLGVFPKRLKSKKFSNFTLIETDKLNINFLKNI